MMNKSKMVADYEPVRADKRNLCYFYFQYFRNQRCLTRIFHERITACEICALAIRQLTDSQSFGLRHWRIAQD